MCTTDTYVHSAAMVIQEKEMLKNKHNHASSRDCYLIHDEITFLVFYSAKDADHNHHVIRGTRPHLNLPIYMAPWDL